ncbi:MAG: site-specific DNA-methyltransferase [Candidatus Omnitrophota bacterium]
MTAPADETFNGLSAKEWTLLSKNVWNDLSSPRQSHHLLHGATFPLALAERVVSLYSGKGDIVFDPFAGIGTTVIAASKLDRVGIGIELQEQFCKLATSLIDKEKMDLFSDKQSVRHEVICDDCRALDKHLYSNSVQLTLTAPPYPDMDTRPPKSKGPGRPRKSDLVGEMSERVPAHSLRQDDFGNFGYAMYLEELARVFKKVLHVTRDGGYSIWVIRDQRDTHNGAQYVPVHSDIINLGVAAGWRHHDLIVWDQNDQRRLMLLGYPNVFYSNLNCSYLVVFRKPKDK